MTDVATLKRRFGIIGTSPALDRAISVAERVAATDISVLVLGESGTGKEVMPRIIHHASTRKHGPYIAVNCGAIPEGTIDSELFGHEKGSFTGATEARKGYFEEAHGGTIFLDEVAELPLTTQVRLLRVLETGEFIRVGSSKVLKTDVRVVAATNVDFGEAIASGRFREDLYYRLNQVPISMPPLRERPGDIHLLFRKFTTDFSEQYRMPPLQLTAEAVELLASYGWPGNVRQLKNTAEQMSILLTDRTVDADTLLGFLPEAHRTRLPVRLGAPGSTDPNTLNEREIPYKVLFDMRAEIHDLKQLVMGLIAHGGRLEGADAALAERVFRTDGAAWVLEEDPAAPLHPSASAAPSASTAVQVAPAPDRPTVTGTTSVVRFPAASPAEPSLQVAEEVDEVLSLSDSERELIRRALRKHGNRRRNAAAELGISERTLYRKIKEFGLG